jgi:hypothetical protein
MILPEDIPNQTFALTLTELAATAGHNSCRVLAAML